MTPDTAAAALGASHTVALLIPLDLDPTAGARGAWAVARACPPGRQVALIDLTVGEPALDAGADSRGPAGIGDVLAFGASWSHVARPQALPHLHYVPAGTPPADPRDVWSHARWDRLRNGFRAAGALLLLYAPPTALADLGPRADAVMLLGDGPAAARVRSYAAGRGLPAIGPVTLPPAPLAAAAAAPAVTPARAGRWLPWAVGAAVAATVFAVASILYILWR